jgi:hypothetical protein
VYFDLSGLARDPGRRNSSENLVARADGRWRLLDPCESSTTYPLAKTLRLTIVLYMWISSCFQNTKRQEYALVAWAWV